MAGAAGTGQGDGSDGDSGDDGDIILCVIQLCMNNLGFKLIEWIFL